MGKHMVLRFPDKKCSAHKRHSIRNRTSREPAKEWTSRIQHASGISREPVKEWTPGTYKLQGFSENR